MMRSLFSGVAGLKTHQTKMDVIGNNIANVNTTAYKSQSVTFRDLMYQTTQRASGANEFVGGTNAKQIGLGVTTGAINASITSQGSAQTTNNPFDVMITGSAFFVVNNGQENFFTRDGSFYLDGQGNLAMTSNGYKVMGWAADPATGELNKDSVAALQIMNEANMTYEAEATSQARISGIIDKYDTKVNSSSGHIVNMEFYDSMGYKYTARYSLHGTKDDGSFYVQLDSILDAKGKPVSDDIMNSVSFGNPTLNVEVAKLYNTVNATAIGTGTFTIGTTDAVTGTIGIAQQPPRAGTNDAQLAVLKEAYPGIDFSKVATYTIDGNGTLKVNTVVTSPADDGLVGKEIKATAGKFVPQNVVVTDKADATITETFTPGQIVDATAANKATIKALYGLDIDASGATEFQVNQDGSITVTKMNVKNAAKLEYNVSGVDPKGQLLSANGNGEGKMTLSFGGQARFKDITVDFSGTSNVNNKETSTVAFYAGDTDNRGGGRTVGSLLEVGISKDGTISATYSNNMSKVLGQIAVTTFANASGLEKQGDNLYSATANSGNFDGVGKDITSEGGRMDSGVLEMSNVDLSAEFTEMITTQRGFQANSRIITVSDTMLEELTNLKR